jgi:hypothetical protein
MLWKPQRGDRQWPGVEARFGPEPLDKEHHEMTQAPTGRQSSESTTNNRFCHFLDCCPIYEKQY